MGGLSTGQSFVQAPEHRPKPTVTEATGIPLIDLSPLTSGDAAAVDALAAELGAASREWGFFLVAGHGVPAETVALVTEAQRAFFALPAERKAAVRKSETAPLGYYESEHTKNVRDWKEVFDLVAHQPPPPPAVAVAGGEVVYVNKWPEDLRGFREALDDQMPARHDDRIGVDDCDEPVRVFSMARRQAWSNDRYESAEHRVSVNPAKALRGLHNFPGRCSSQTKPRSNSLSMPKWAATWHARVLDDTYLCTGAGGGEGRRFRDRIEADYEHLTRFARPIIVMTVTIDMNRKEML
ncbi:hypothetical protein BAE44_0020813 [Dichanthelium oligosanthes]|uniref:Non-haem dioxygenase N-terminal domain-containing protein n=1 Tax=Dichanthelium oligosanthes TaxID=888268 RepID=A0A1E5UZB4_9POAL|nr:hypothetical protein BAE44_0020813 [Dichanthelium oligosanthes]